MKKILKKLRKYQLLVILIELVIVIFLAKALLTQHEELVEAKEKTFVAENITSEINVKILTENIQKIGELATTEYIYTNAAKFTNSEHILDFTIPLTTKSFIVRWNGSIKAGIDATKIKADVNKKDKKITVQVPEAEILSHEIDDDSTEILNETNNLFNPISIDDAYSFVGDNKKFMEERVEDIGVLDEATDNTKTLIINFLSTFDGISDDYTVKVEVE